MLSELSIYYLIKNQAEKNPDAIAITAPDRIPLTYRGLLNQIDRIIIQLNAVNIGCNDPVAISLPNGPEMAVAFLSIASCATCAPLNPNYRSNEFDFYLEDLNAKALILQPGIAEAARSVAKQRNIPIIELSPLLEAEAGIFKLSNSLITAHNPQDQNPNPKSDDVALILHTSGTTSRPKMVPLTQKNLCTSAKNIRLALDLKPADRCLNVMPLFHIHGLMGALLSSISAGASVACPPGFSAPQFFDWLEELKPTWYSAVPTMHQSILARIKDNYNSINNNSISFIRSSSAPLPPQVMAELEKTFNAPVIESYGMTEASHQMASNPLPPLVRKPGSVGIAAGPEIAIMDEEGNLLNSGEVGEIVIRGANVTQGYANNHEANKQAFTNGWFRTGDHGYLDEDNYLFLKGRIKEIINRGGEKISPREVDEVLLDHPAIEQVVTFAAPHQLLGEDVAAAVVLKSNTSVTEREIQEFAAQKLADFKVPRVVLFVDEIPKGATGKQQRIGLAEKLGLTASNPTLPRPDYIAPRTSVEEQLVEIWSEVLSIQQIGMDDNFFQLGGDSITATQIVNRVRELLQVELSFLIFFQQPTVAKMALTITQSQADISTSIQPTPRNQDLPLSFAQQRLWFLDQLEGKSPAYNMPMALHLQGELKIPALEKTLNTIIQRHETLRTNITTSEGKPQIIIHENLQLELSIIDLENIPEAQRNLEAEELIKQERLQPFDLENHPLIRCKLLRLQPQEHILLITIHHIISDGWSINLLNQEIGKIYNAFVEGKPSPLSELTIQYIDFVAWQKEYLTGETFQQQLAYWKKQLEDAPPLLTFPTDYPRPTIQTFTGEKYSHCLSENLSNSLKELSKQEGVTLFITLLTGFKILLYRYTGEKDIILGSPVAGRNRREVEPLIGFFINTLVLRTNLDDNPTFKELLAVVKKVALEGYEYQAMPFEKLVEELQPERNLSHNPIFQVWFNMVNLEFKPLEMSGLEVETIASNEGFSKFDLTLYVREKENEIQLDWSYNRDLYQPETIATIAKHLKNLLESIVVNPEQSISTVPLLTELKTQQLKNYKNAIQSTQAFTEFTKAEIEQSIPARFEKQVIKYSQNIAIKSNTYQWNYEILNQKANQISANLIKQCGKQSQKIALLFEHDAPMIAAILGVLKAGKTYIPLDPNYPQSRINYILADAQATAILTNHKNHHLAQKLNQQNLTIINIDNSNLEAEINLGNQSISPDTIAYILYTSGSTGQPKGVVQNHRNVLHFIRNYTNNLHISSSDKLTLIASYSFDAAVMDIWGGLLNGATLCLYDLKTVGLTNLTTWLQTEKITIYHSTPTVYRYFLQTLENQVKDNLFPEMRLVVLGGEAVVKKDVDLYQQYFPDDCLFVNGLGPTESTVTLQYFLNKQTTITQNTVAVGYPVEETEILLLDDTGNDSQIYGEIGIKSPYVALGYWQKPELTSQVFLPDSDNKNQRIYRTGDLGRLRPDGTIEFLGRKDFQVKIRGFRIELGEIETTLNQHPNVKESVVIAREDTLTEKQLVAYYIPQEYQTETPQELRNFLQQKLPEYMIPSVFVQLEKLPLTPNGKIDRRALPKPDTSEDKTKDEYIAPRNELELQLQKIWEKVLNVKSISIRDNFFELGGHSLLALQLFSQIKQKIGQDIPLAILFQAPTIQEFASIFHQSESSPSRLVKNPTNLPFQPKESVSYSSLVSIQPNGLKPPLFFTNSIAAAKTLATFLSSEQPLYGLSIFGLPDMDEKQLSSLRIEDIAEQFIQDMRYIQPEGPYLIGAYCGDARIAFEMAQQLYSQGEKVAQLAFIDVVWNPHNLGSNLYWQNFQKIGFDYLRKKIRGKLNLTLENIIRLINKINESFNSKIDENLDIKIKHEKLLQAFYKARKIYVPQTYSGQIALFLSREWQLKNSSELANLATGGFEIQEIPGYHHLLFEEPYVQVLAEKLQSCLDRAVVEYQIK